MSIQYGLIKRSGILASDELNVQAIKRNLINSNAIAREVQQRCTVTTADVHAVLDVLSSLLGDHLLNGDHVKLDGIGTFSVSMDGKVHLDKAGRLQLTGARVRKVRFQAAKSLRERMKTATFTKEGAIVNASDLSVTEADVRKCVDALCAEHHLFTIKQLSEATKLTEATARRRLQPLIADGTIVQESSRPRILYRKA